MAKSKQKPAFVDFRQIAIVDIDSMSKETEQDLERQIREFMAIVSVNERFAITGDHNYILEDDGTIFMELSGQRTSIQYWTRDLHWKIFQEDVCNNRFVQKLEQLRAVVQNRIRKQAKK